LCGGITNHKTKGGHKKEKRRKDHPVLKNLFFSLEEHPRFKKTNGGKQTKERKKETR